MGLDSEVWIRLPFVLAGSLTVLAAYWVVPDKRFALAISIFVALCPLLSFWSGLARPYAFAGLFMVLGFRWWWFYPVAVLTTPISIVGLNLFRLKKFWWAYLVFILGAGILFMIRSDTNRNFLKWDFLIYAKRLWVLPVLSLAVHGALLLSGQSQRTCKNNI